MMNFPLSYILILYGFILLIGCIFILVNIMHLLVFGLQSFKTALAIICYLGFAGAIVGYSLLLILRYDWSQELMIDEFLSSFIETLL